MIAVLCATLRSDMCIAPDSDWNNVSHIEDVGERRTIFLKTDQQWALVALRPLGRGNKLQLNPG